MNKIIFTNDRYSWLWLVPGARVKLVSFIRCSPRLHFIHPSKKIFTFTRNINRFPRNVCKIKYGIYSILDFKMIKNLENCLLVFDDSWEKIYQEQAFVKHAVAGRHRKLHCIFVKHSLLHQSKWSRTIDLNTTLAILFKS